MAASPVISTYHTSKERKQEGYQLVINMIIYRSITDLI